MKQENENDIDLEACNTVPYQKVCSIILSCGLVGSLTSEDEGYFCTFH